MIDSFTGSYSFLSNFYPVLVEYEGLTYYSSEAAYQAAKTLDPEARVAFTYMDAGQAKRAGGKLKLREDWYQVKLQVMRSILTIKFADPELRKMLLATGEQQIVETNTWGDRFFGVCGGKGSNHLGLLLMEIRGIKPAC